MLSLCAHISCARSIPPAICSPPLRRTQGAQSFSLLLASVVRLARSFVTAAQQNFSVSPISFCRRLCACFCTQTRTQHQLSSSSGLHTPSLCSVVGPVLRCVCLRCLMFSRGSAWTLASFQRLPRSAVVSFTCDLPAVAQTCVVGPPQ